MLVTLLMVFLLYCLLQVDQDCGVMIGTGTGKVRLMMAMVLIGFLLCNRVKIRMCWNERVSAANSQRE